MATYYNSMCTSGTSPLQIGKIQDKIGFRLFEITSGTNIDEETIEIINSSIHQLNPAAKPFTGIEKGKIFEPYEEGEYKILKLN